MYDRYIIHAKSTHIHVWVAYMPMHIEHMAWSCMMYMLTRRQES